MPEHFGLELLQPGCLIMSVCLCANEPSILLSEERNLGAGEVIKWKKHPPPHKLGLLVRS